MLYPARLCVRWADLHGRNSFPPPPGSGHKQKTARREDGLLHLLQRAVYEFRESVVAPEGHSVRDGTRGDIIAGVRCALR